MKRMVPKRPGGVLASGVVGAACRWNVALRGGVVLAQPEHSRSRRRPAGKRRREEGPERQRRPFLASVVQLR